MLQLWIQCDGKYFHFNILSSHKDSVDANKENCIWEGCPRCLHWSASPEEANSGNTENLSSEDHHHDDAAFPQYSVLWEAHQGICFKLELLISAFHLKLADTDFHFFHCTLAFPQLWTCYAFIRVKFHVYVDFSAWWSFFGNINCKLKSHKNASVAILLLKTYFSLIYY